MTRYLPKRILIELIDFGSGHRPALGDAKRLRHCYGRAGVVSRDHEHPHSRTLARLHCLKRFWPGWVDQSLKPQEPQLADTVVELVGGRVVASGEEEHALARPGEAVDFLLHSRRVRVTAARQQRLGRTLHIANGAIAGVAVERGHELALGVEGNRVEAGTCLAHARHIDAGRLRRH